MEEVKERMLAHVEQVADIEPIDGCDNIEYVTVLGWHVIQRKNSVKIGDKVVYIEIDSQVPNDNPAFAFLESRKYKVKSIKMRGVISQGLIMTFDDLGLKSDKFNIGDDVTDVLGIKKIDTEEEQRLRREEDSMNEIKKKHPKFFQNWFIKKLMKFKFFRWLFLGRKKKDSKGFPDFIHKTDETRIENMPSILKDTETKWLETEKIDGTSSTYAIKKIGRNKFEFIVCSRNVRQPDYSNLKELESNPNNYWEMAFKYNIKDALIGIFNEQHLTDNQVVILQGEIIGEGIQGNPYKLKGRDFRGYNLIINDTKSKIYGRFNSINAAEKLEEYGIKWVPILGYVNLPDNMRDMKDRAEGESKITPGVKREGCVYRSEDGQKSFKNVSNSYLLKHNG